MSTPTPTSKANALHGIRVLLTRPDADAAATRGVLEAAGATVYSLPTVDVRFRVLDMVQVNTVMGCDAFDWVVFTSRNAARALLALGWGRSPQHPLRPRIAAIGRGTASSLRASGVELDLIGDGSGADSLVSSLTQQRIDGARVLLPVGNLAGTQLQRGLEEAGALVTRMCVYDTVAPESYDHHVLDQLLSHAIDTVLFASPSAFRNLLTLDRTALPNALRRTHILVIGNTTAAEVRSAGYQLAAVAADPSAPAVLAAVCAIHALENR